jgi:hypothetical protein
MCCLLLHLRHPPLLIMKKYRSRWFNENEVLKQKSIAAGQTSNVIQDNFKNPTPLNERTTGFVEADEITTLHC